MRTSDDSEQHLFHKLNQAIEIGLSQIKSGKTVSALDAFERIKKKIARIRLNLALNTGAQKRWAPLVVLPNLSCSAQIAHFFIF